MARKRTSVKGALELLEEAVHLLRLAPLQTWLCYYIGALPFVLGFLFFWADMSRSAFAAEHCGRAAFGLVLLFIWMKTWQTIFAAELARQISGKPPERWTFSRVARIAVSQTILQPSGFFLLPIALLIVLPFGWLFAFYQNAVALGGVVRSQPLFKRAVQQAGIFNNQNLVGLLILSAFGLFVWLNLVTLLYAIPNLLKMFFGIETVFTQAGFHAFLNTTFVVTSFALTYLCVDPLIKSFYALRCFYGQAVTTGEDLKVDLKSRTAPLAAAVLALVAFLPFPQNATANSPNAEPSAVVQAGSVPVPDLDKSIEKVLDRPEFTWRLPREKTEDANAKKNWLVLFLESVWETVAGWMRTLRDWGRDFIEWLGKYFSPKNPESGNSSGGGDWLATLRFMVFALIALIASALVILFIRMWKRREKKPAIVAEALLSVPDLADENVSANQLPEDGWLKLARELMDKGDLRLALRALYLAGLAHLAEREFLSIAKFKSNREYEQELRRRARALPALQKAFGQNVTTFDRIWYGMHDVTHEILHGFQSNLERIRAS